MYSSSSYGDNSGWTYYLNRAALLTDGGVFVTELAVGIVAPGPDRAIAAPWPRQPPQ
jgi:hypothetical protein